ncbi:hypothetical protein [Pseudodesulfovibrio piezophilus]|uniref:Uncharacterized protein n=1 Tax=Pseudodesulfovibrio piezophilus (strain DSM 21447 / JCM 15486 / C1TLV30) TaxID=1322246 RepID=M1WRA4_PSEP2|nr:hypothetical protein [Pseudodesulfovibrio piezophilus]CCH49414.1 conserved protein of unknown function [Pseudodesulfovibrio piezophilus C1TLV30]
MTQETKRSFEWKEVCDLFCIRDEENLEDEEREKILSRINKVTDEHGREYVIRKIALVTQ